MVHKSGLVHTYPDIFDSGDVFSVLAFRSRVNGVFGLEKTLVFENGRQTEIFENVGLTCSCGGTKPEVFEYDDVINHIAHAL